MKKTMLMLSMAVVMFSELAAQVTVQGITFPAKLAKDNKFLVLNGAGVRNRFFMNVYVLGLYLPKKESDAKKIINADEPTFVRLQIISSLITQERMGQAIREGFQKSTKGNTKPIQKEIDQVVAIFYKDPIKVGDVFDIWYTPGKGVTASKNGKQYNFLIHGLQFKKYLFGIWLGEEPVDDPLKDKLLGL